VGKRRDELGMLARDFDSMADKLARAAAQQTELSRNISHELRSPLARMRVAL
jgi:two-component system sensor histidine kinase CpxA